MHQAGRTAERILAGELNEGRNHKLQQRLPLLLKIFHSQRVTMTMLSVPGWQRKQLRGGENFNLSTRL